MSDNAYSACKVLHNNLLPRARFLRESFAALAEQERADESKDGTTLYDGAVIAMDDIIAAASEVMDLLEG